MADENGGSLMNNPVVQVIAAVLALGGFTLGGTAHFKTSTISDHEIAVIQAAVSEAVEQVISPPAEESLPRFIGRVGDEHEDCVEEAGELDDTVEKLLSTLVCDMDRQYEYMKRAAR